MSGVGFISQYNMTTTLHAAVLALDTNAVQKTLCELAFMGLSGTQNDV
jgi:hypothetical protein